MKKVEKGDKIKIKYVGTFDDGEVFDATDDNDTFEFTVGADEVIVGLDNAVLGMEKGEKKKVRIEAEDAYGDYDDNLLVSLGKESVPDGVELEEGESYSFEMENGGVMDLILMEVKEDELIFDANHELAGMPLTFDFEIVEIG